VRLLVLVAFLAAAPGSARGEERLRPFHVEAGVGGTFGGGLDRLALDLLFGVDFGRARLTGAPYWGVAAGAAVEYDVGASARADQSLPGRAAGLAALRAGLAWTRDDDETARLYLQAGALAGGESHPHPQDLDGGFAAGLQLQLGITAHRWMRRDDPEASFLVDILSIAFSHGALVYERWLGEDRFGFRVGFGY
jgi:hypothetical protein